MDHKDKFDILLMGFKQQASTQDAMDNIIFVFDSKDMLMCKAIVAWKSVKSRVDFSEGKEIKDDWEYVWQFCRFDSAAFGNLLGIKQHDATQLIMRLKSLRLIYPDGTVNHIANGVVRGILKQNIERTTGQKVGA